MKHRTSKLNKLGADPNSALNRTVEETRTVKKSVSGHVRSNTDGDEDGTSYTKKSIYDP